MAVWQLSSVWICNKCHKRILWFSEGLLVKLLHEMLILCITCFNSSLRRDWVISGEFRKTFGHWQFTLGARFGKVRLSLTESLSPLQKQSLEEYVVQYSG